MTYIIHVTCQSVNKKDYLDIRDLLCHHNLTQIINAPRQKSNILDLIVTNWEAMYCKPVIIPQLTDHNIVKCAA